MSKLKKGFNLRSFTSFSLAVSTVIMAWSGFILYIAPPGRIANWGTWKLMLFTKSEWQALHTIFSYLFFIFFIVHLFFVNWKTFLAYFKSKIKAGLNKKWELAAAMLLSVVVFIGTLYSWTPFGPVMSFGEKMKESWSNKFETPPALHMEDYTLNQLSVMFDSTAVHEIQKTLIDSGIKIRDNDSTLKQIADGNKTKPVSIYNVLASKYKKAEDHVQGGGGQGQGLGRTTVESIARNKGTDMKVIIGRLKEMGIEADRQTTLRSIAEKMGITPGEAYEILNSW
jgi:hypothetical protein